MKKRLCIRLLILTATLCFITTFTGHLQHVAKITHLLVEEDAMELLRQQEVPTEKYESFCDYAEDSEYSRQDYLLGYLMTGEDGIQELDAYLSLLHQYHSQKIRVLEKYEKEILLVGITYHKKKKEHRCIIEKVQRGR